MRASRDKGAVGSGGGAATVSVLPRRQLNGVKVVLDLCREGRFASSS